jgi:hypothetical protein
MNMEPPFFSDDFKRLYCDAVIYESFSALHPVSFRRVLPFQHQQEGVDDRHLLLVEEAHMAAPSDHSRRAVVEEYNRCGLLEEKEAQALREAVDFFDADFFELMGVAYANTGRFRCALRWYREVVTRFEVQNPNLRTDSESVYASVGYCLYSLGLYEEAIVWSKACIGPHQTADVVCRTLIEYEAQLAGGGVCAIERAGPRTKYVVSSFEPGRTSQTTPRLKLAINAFVPFHEVYLDWISHDSPRPEPWPQGYPFNAEFDGGSLIRHKMNLIFATCGLSDRLIARGYRAEAKRLLWEANLTEPAAEIVTERLRALA